MDITAYLRGHRRGGHLHRDLTSKHIWQIQYITSTALSLLGTVMYSISQAQETEMRSLAPGDGIVRIYLKILDISFDKVS